jgi:hypothetical protein
MKFGCGAALGTSLKCFRFIFWVTLIFLDNHSPTTLSTKLPITLPAPLEIMEVDAFQIETSLFLSWLSNMGVSMNPEIALVDLRSSGRGRAVGEFLIQGLTGNTWAVLLECPFLSPVVI